ncbi:glycosyltransferase family 4 protein [Streptomyces sp. BK205]|uniref:glycosyltransferase family 4 protein n=1 Tax=Streptomyces sp. BK205 TaxID=2512164 RepID=UPI001404305C|nr:glycosyltransferase family 4 protein [Streptomyces sp. BK205]
MAWRNAEHLARRGHEVTVRTDSPAPAGLTGVTVRVPGKENGPSGGRPDLVHAFDLGRPEAVGEALLTARQLDVPFLLTPATDSSVWPDSAAGRDLCQRADLLFTITRTEEEALRAMGVAPERLARISQAADLSGTPRPKTFRRRHGIGGPLVLFVGRRAGFKGYQHLLGGMATVWRELPETTFAFAGPNVDPDAEALFGRYADDRVLDLGVIGERTKHDALAACDVLCLPSRADVFPLVFVEAWCCGKPVVSGDFPGAHQVVRHGVDGLVVEPGAASVAEALTDLLSDPSARQAMGRAGRVRAEGELSWESVAAQVEAGYRTVAERCR